MRAGNIFVTDLVEANLLHKVHKIRVSLYGSLALTGEGHMTPSGTFAWTWPAAFLFADPFPAISTAAWSREPECGNSRYSLRSCPV